MLDFGKLLGFALPGILLLACGSGGGGGGSGNSTTFKGVASGDGRIFTFVLKVNTISFSPPAPVFPTASNLSATVPATATFANGLTGTYSGTWDEANNTLSVSSANLTMDGGYNVPSNQIGGTINLTATGEVLDWIALRGQATTLYCGPSGSGEFMLVIGGGVGRGYFREFGASVEGTVSGNTLTFTNGAVGTATFGANISGTKDGTAFSGTACG